MYEAHEEVIKHIDELVDFLEKNGVEAEYRSYLEDDYLRAHRFYENHKNHPEITQDDSDRAAYLGLFELYKWIWSVKDIDEFSKLDKHLRLLIEASPRINSNIPIISPVTDKQDEKSNKFVEAIIGMFAVKIGTNVDLDDPFVSSGGRNPDVLFDFCGKRIGIACKTLRGNSERTIVDNLKTASNQIKRADCDLGYALINAMNILPHEKIKDRIFDNQFEPVGILSKEITDLYIEARTRAENEMFSLFQNRKIRPAVLTFIHSAAKFHTPYGVASTSLKSTFATNLEIPGIDVTEDLQFLAKVNEFIHNRL